MFISILMSMSMSNVTAQPMTSRLRDPPRVDKRHSVDLTMFFVIYSLLLLFSFPFDPPILRPHQNRGFDLDCFSASSANFKETIRILLDDPGHRGWQSSWHNQS